MTFGALIRIQNTDRVYNAQFKAYFGLSSLYTCHAWNRIVDLGFVTRKLTTKALTMDSFVDEIVLHRGSDLWFIEDI